MMNKEKIQSKLTELFNQHRVIFWNDPEEDFEDDREGDDND